MATWNRTNPSTDQAMQSRAGICGSALPKKSGVSSVERHIWIGTVFGSGRLSTCSAAPVLPTRPLLFPSTKRLFGSMLLQPGRSSVTPAIEKLPTRPFLTVLQVRA
jgi:hypothetical protein